MTRKNNNIATSRRTFLCKLGRFAMTSPLAVLGGTNLFWARSALAEDLPAQRKAVFVFMPGGAAGHLWNPSLGCLTSKKLPAMSQPLEPVKEECLFLSSVDYRGFGFHSPPSYSLGGRTVSSTLDTHLAKTIGAAAPFPHVALGVETSRYGDPVVSLDQGMDVRFESNPELAFAQLFGGKTSALPQETRHHLSVLDINLRQLRTFEKTLTGQDREFIQQRISEVERLSMKLQSPSSGESACESPMWEHAATTDFVETAKAQIDLAVLALKCGLTQVLTLQLGNHEGHEIYFPQTGIKDDFYHVIEAGPPEGYTLFRQELSKILRYLIEALALHTDVDGKRILDNTMLLHVSNGGHAQAQDSKNSPYMFAGGAAGNILPGRSIDGSGTMGDVLDTAAVAMGVDIENPAYERYGNHIIEGVLTL